MRRCFLIPTCLLLANVAQAATPQIPYGCPAYREPRITVTPIYTQTRYDDEESLNAIARLAGETHRSPSGALEIPVGLTASSLMLKSSFEITSNREPGDNLYCAQITDFKFSFGFDNTTVYIAREVPRYSCGYDQVLTHENRHVQTDRDLMQYYLPRLQPILAEAVRATGAVRVADPDTAQRQFSRLMDFYLQQLSQRLTAERRRQQERIDTPEEYARLSKTCNGQISRLVSNR